MFNTGRGLFPMGSSALGLGRTGINWASLFSTAQKTLGIANQAIPLFYQIKPIYNNAKTMFKVANAFKEPKQNTKKQANQTKQQQVTKEEQKEEPTSTNMISNISAPQFFL